MEPYVPDRKSKPVNRDSLVYPALYNGPVNYFARLVRESEIILEIFDHYSKQTYRNRCLVMGPNGVMALSIPIKKIRGEKNLLKDVRVDYQTPWNKIHWRSLTASYTASPYFEYYRDDLAPFYEKRTEFLVDLNLQLLECTLRMMNLHIPVHFSKSFREIDGSDDPRLYIHPKKNQAVFDPAFQPVGYHQVFADRLGFRSNLSFLDLLFNEGPSALMLLHQSLIT